MPKLFVNTTIKNDGFENLIDHAVKGMQEATGLEFQIEKWKKLPKIASYSKKNINDQKFQKRIYSYIDQLAIAYEKHDELYTLDICDLYLFDIHHGFPTVFQSKSFYKKNTHGSVIISTYNISKEKHESLAYTLAFRQAGAWKIGKDSNNILTNWCNNEECIFWEEAYNWAHKYRTDRKKVDEYIEKKEIIVCSEHKKILKFD